MEVDAGAQGPSFCDDAYAICAKSVDRSRDVGGDAEGVVRAKVEELYAPRGGTIVEALRRNTGCFPRVSEQPIAKRQSSFAYAPDTILPCDTLRSSQAKKPEKIEEAKPKSTLDFFASALLDAVDDDIGGAGDVWRYNDEERLFGSLRKIVGTWVCLKGCEGLKIGAEEGWRGELDRAIEDVLDVHVGGDKVEEFDAVERNHPFHILQIALTRIDFSVKAGKLFNKYDSEDVLKEVSGSE